MAPKKSAAPSAGQPATQLAAPKPLARPAAAECEVAVPAFTQSRPLQLTISGRDDYRRVTGVAERKIRSDCEARALDDARREALRLCHDRGGALQGTAGLVSKIIESYGASVSVDRESRCEFEVVASYTCDLPESPREVAPKEASAFAWADQRQAPEWDAEVQRSPRAFRVIFPGAATKAR